MTNVSAEEIKAAREKYGVGLNEIKNALEKTNDLLVAVGYIKYSGLAVKIHGDRERWNLQNAEIWARLERENV